MNGNVEMLRNGLTTNEIFNIYFCAELKNLRYELHEQFKTVTPEAIDKFSDTFYFILNLDEVIDENCFKEL